MTSLFDQRGRRFRELEKINSTAKVEIIQTKNLFVDSKRKFQRKNKERRNEFVGGGDGGDGDSSPLPSSDTFFDAFRQRNANPTEILLPSGKSIVQRSLLFRNNSGKDFVLKLVASSAAIIFPTTVFRFPPASYRTIQFRVDTKLLNHWDSLTIKGFVLPVYSKSLKQWIERKSTVECPTQEAFHLNLKFGNQFSAPQTVVNLPGNSECIDSTDHPVDVEELDTLTAINIEKDVKTADPIASMMGVVNEHKQRTKSGQGCWLTNLMCGEREEQVEKSQKSAKSAKSCKSESRGHLINDCLDATPCGGSTIKT